MQENREVFLKLNKSAQTKVLGWSEIESTVVIDIVFYHFNSSFTDFELKKPTNKPKQNKKTNQVPTAKVIETVSSPYLLPFPRLIWISDNSL